ncbi:phosphoglucosamine mutase [Candidatus Puniceispirillum marinum IMCC1322]|uniref:Phosphoglucosamine mutase n=1 Tax=Puniceispirillum marinum (strain IMCC1322) TaxID=488538 RepID=D5BPP6_PUNMI|nr:phosphoglucosamine mutase [Candidatus Puniceispirillum marinum IMCC1322]
MKGLRAPLFYLEEVPRSKGTIMAGLFGTDGVRARINTGPMTAEAIVRLALAAGSWFVANNAVGKTGRKAGRPSVVIGKDTRLSGYMLESALVAGFTSIGMDCRLLGPVPTPAVAYLTSSLRAELGVMISASHNPHSDNGIKLFGPDGYKLDDAIETEISQLAAGSIALAEPENLGRARRMLDSVGRYVEFAKAAFPRNLRLDGMKIVVDCANGAAYRTAPDTLFELGVDVIPLAVTPNGMNINDMCGAVSPQMMAAAVVTHGADAGIALDGDADRLIMADEKGHLLDGDQLLATLAYALQQSGSLAGGGVVGTVMSNRGLELKLAEWGLDLHRSKVGDRYILETMRKTGINLGGEQSGHILLSDYATTGDGLLAALQMLALLKRSDKNASDLFTAFTPSPQKLENIYDIDRTILADDALQADISKIEASMNGQGRVLVRASGTENLIRVMVEADEMPLLDNVMQELILRIQSATK